MRLLYLHLPIFFRRLFVGKTNQDQADETAYEDLADEQAEDENH